MLWAKTLQKKHWLSEAVNHLGFETNLYFHLRIYAGNMTAYSIF